jgi:hypothetical protein
VIVFAEGIEQELVREVDLTGYCIEWYIVRSEDTDGEFIEVSATHSLHVTLPSSAVEFDLAQTTLATGGARWRHWRCSYAGKQLRLSKGVDRRRTREDSK